MKTVLLVHGAWHGSWCWAKVVSLLQRDGLDAVALDLPGRAGDATPVEALTLDRYARAVCHAARLQRQPVVAVGHSLGGVIITQAAEYEPQRFAKLVYLCAFLPGNGQSLQDLAQDDAGLVGPNIQPDTPKGYYSFREDAPLRDIFYHDCSEEDARRAEAMLVPEPMAPFVTPVGVTEQRFGRVPRAYIVCRQDRAIPPSLQSRMSEAVPCHELYDLDTSHSPFFSAPRELAQLIREAGGR
jgi:pimeloyl-ACP methyl ester carboxylesterase